MEPLPESISFRTLVGFLVLAGVIGAVAWPIVLVLGGEGRPIAIRVAAALFSAAVLSRLVRVVRGYSAAGAPSPVELALHPRRADLQLDPLLGRIAGELGGLRWSAHAALKERLRGLCAKRLGGIPEALARSGGRLKRGEVERIVDRLENP